MSEQDPLQMTSELEVEVKYDEERERERTIVEKWNQREKERIRESMKKLGISKIIGFETLPEPTAPGTRKIIGTVAQMQKQRIKMERENKKKRATDRVRKYRKNMTEDAKNLVRARDRKRKAERLAQMSEDERKNLRKKHRIKTLTKRQAMSDEKKNTEYEINKIRPTKKKVLNDLNDNCDETEIKNHVGEGSSKINEADTPPDPDELIKIKSCDQILKIDISCKDFNDFVDLLNNEVKCKLLPIDIFGNFERTEEREEKYVQNELNSLEAERDNSEEVSNLNQTQEDKKGAEPFKIKDHIDADEGYCKECDKYFKGKQGLHYHWKVMHEIKEKKHNCDLCDFKTEYKFKLKHHITKSHNPKTRRTCDLCGKSYASGYKLRLHVREVHEGSRKYSCTECDFTASRGYELKNHKYSKHNEGTHQPLLCEFCPYSNVKQASLKNHRERMHMQLKYKCETEGCEYIANCRSSAREHKALHTAQQNGDSLQCSTCGKEFLTKKRLTSHGRYHKDKTEPTEKKCDFCDYKTLKPKMLDRHVYFRHTRENAKEKERYKGWDWEVMREKWRNGKGKRKGKKKTIKT